MAITITHPFVSAKPDGGDASLVQPSNWNDNHSVTGTIDVANGGTGANTAADARTNLGLGTIATQDANNVALSGGSISGVTITSLDSNTTIQDNADPTKQMQFELSGITGGQTSVLTVPDADGTLTLNAATQTLTNKTINLTSNTLTGTKAEFNTAVSDDNFAYVGTANTFSTNQLISVNSASNALEIRQIGAGNALVVEDSANPDSTPFVITSTGVAVIGHSSPITVGTSAVGCQVVYQGATQANYSQVRYSNDTTASGMYVGKSRATTAGSNGIVSSGDNLATWKTYGDDGAAFIEAAKIEAAVDGTPGTNDMPGRLVFSTTADGASSPTERYRIASDGKHTYAGYAALTNATNNAAFTITNTGSGNSFVVEDSASTDSTPFVIDAGGALIRGHTATVNMPAGDGGSYAVAMETLGANAAGSSIGAAIYNNAASTFGASLSLAKSNSASVGSHAIVSSGDLLGGVFYSGSDGTNFIRAAQITAVVDGTPGTNDMPGRLVFSTTADGASTPTERMRIDSAGRIGIGVTPSTANKIQVTDTISDSTAYSTYYQVNLSATSGATNYAGTYQLVVPTAAFAGTGVISGMSFNMTNQSPNTISDVRGYNTTYATTGGGTVTSLYGYFVQGPTMTSGAIGSHYGFYVSSGMTGATNNYGFYSNIASGAGRWNFYAAGTAANHFTGVTTHGVAFGYGTTAGAGGTVTQLASRTTGVTINTPSGAITLVSAAGTTSWQTFTVTNSSVAATDVVIVNQKSGTDKYMMHVTAVAAGSFAITFATTGGTTTEQPVFNFALIKGATS